MKMIFCYHFLLFAYHHHHHHLCHNVLVTTTTGVGEIVTSYPKQNLSECNLRFHTLFKKFCFGFSLCGTQILYLPFDNCLFVCPTKSLKLQRRIHKAVIFFFSIALDGIQTLWWGGGRNPFLRKFFFFLTKYQSNQEIGDGTLSNLFFSFFPNLCENQTKRRCLNLQDQTVMFWLAG